MQPKQNIVIAFLAELLKRFFDKSPKFFRIWQGISGVAAIVTGLPEFLTLFNIVLPAPFDILTNKFIAAVSAGMFFMSTLTSQSQPIVEDGKTKIDEKKLPFSAQHEANKNG